MTTITQMQARFMSKAYNKTVDPVPSDAAPTYAVGDFWFNQTANTIFINADSTAGAAVWVQVGGGAAADENVKVTATDTTASYLYDKIDQWGNDPAIPSTSKRTNLGRFLANSGANEVLKMDLRIPSFTAAPYPTGPFPAIWMDETTLGSHKLKVWKDTAATYDTINLGAPSVSAATETVAGIAEIATQAETDAGTDDARIVTPLKYRAGIAEVSATPSATKKPVFISSGTAEQAVGGVMLPAKSSAFYATSGATDPTLIGQATLVSATSQSIAAATPLAIDANAFDQLIYAQGSAAGTTVVGATFLPNPSFVGQKLTIKNTSATNILSLVKATLTNAELTADLILGNNGVLVLVAKSLTTWAEIDRLEYPSTAVLRALYAYQTVNQALPAGANTNLSLDTVGYNDFGSGFTTGASTNFTVPAGYAGLYHITVAFGCAAATNYGVMALIDINGTEIHNGNTSNITGAGAAGMASTATIIKKLSVGDVVRPRAYSNPGSTTTSYFAGHRRATIYIGFLGA